MKSDFLADLLENTARAKLMRAMIFNENDIFTATNALKRTGVTKKTAQKEFKAMEKLGLVKQSRSVTVQTAGGKKSAERKLTEKAWSLNTDFTHMRVLASFVREVSPFRFEQVLESIKKTGKISAVILSGSFMGDPTRPTDILLAVLVVILIN